MSASLLLLQLIWNSTPCFFHHLPCALQFELLANGDCWGSVANLMVNGQKHYPVYTTNYDSTGKK
jgi:hypothetical protein